MAEAILKTGENGYNEMEFQGRRIPFRSILDLEERPMGEEGRPSFYLDLNLNQVIDRICRDWGADTASFYYYFPANAACEDYRREIYEDIRDGGCFKGLCRFLTDMQARSEAACKKEEVREKMQKAAWHMKEILCYCEAVEKLYQELDQLTLGSKGMIAFRAYLQQYLASAEFKDMREKAAAIRDSLMGFRLRVVYENDRMTVTLGETEGAYDKFLRESFPERKQEMEELLGNSVSLSELESELVRILQKQSPAIFKSLWKFYRSYGDYASQTLLRFASEIRFYLSFYRFAEQMGEKGFSFARPCYHRAEMSAEGLYDLALACGRGEEHEIVSNDFRYGQGERIFVLTGPNQGGKTTFARSLGQLVYFTKMGLDVPARSAQMFRFTELLTHFSVEESVETGRGKLKEELVRLAPMMELVRNASGAAGEREYCGFVIINELFTTAANYDACIMGKRVLEHFLSEGCMGIYVTHLKELAKERGGIVSLRAMVDPLGRRNFHIARGEALESAGAVNQVRKYRLTYEELKRRLS